ncbi:hypothetical protein BH20VER3_BH20VER3_19070 [soil metagenome]
MSARLRRIHALLHHAVDWVLWSEEEPGREREAIRRLRGISLRLLALSWRGK